jgi:methionyl aminopeptidase
VNQEIVHGIPSRKRVLKEGDIVSLDVGVGYKGYFTDHALTVAVGQISPDARRLLEVTQQSLEAGISAARVGNHIGDIGAAVQAVVEGAGFSVVRDLVGHGIGVAFHEEPQVPNYGKPKRREKLVPGLTLAIEPMVNIGGPATKTLGDRWTIVTLDGSLSAHFEHTVAITENGPRVLTRS